MKNSLFSCAEPCFQLWKSFLAPNCHLCNSRFSRRLFFSSKPGPQSADLGSVNKNRKGLDAENKLTEDLQLGDFCPFSLSFESTVQYRSTWWECQYYWYFPLTFLLKLDLIKVIFLLFLKHFFNTASIFLPESWVLLYSKTFAAQKYAYAICNAC